MRQLSSTLQQPFKLIKRTYKQCLSYRCNMITRLCSSLSVFAGCIASQICLPCHAEPKNQTPLIQFSSESTYTPEFPSHFWNQKIRRAELNLISPKLMSSQQLVTSATLIRENTVNQGQCILNNVWLTMEQSKQYDGAKALGRLLSFGIVSYRRALTPEELNNPFDDVMEAFNKEALIAHFKNYDVEVSSKSLALSFKRKI